MSADQKWGIFLIACGLGMFAVEGIIWAWRAANRWATRETKRHVDLALAPLTVTDDDFAEYADEAIALTLPLYGSDGAQRIIAILAANEAARFDADAVDWTQPARWVQ